MNRIRIDEIANYRGIFFNGKTVRQRILPEFPISSLSTPEIEDVAINSKCFAACSYCYTNALKSGNNFDNIIEKAEMVWGELPMNQRPFQIAIGGAGESTLHPDWPEFIKKVKELGIMPNYTTNGMHLSDEILDITEKYCGGVALSYHPHIKGVFEKAMNKLSKIQTRLNLHIIIGDSKSFSDLKLIYETYKDSVEYFVILPYQSVGRAPKIDTTQTWADLFLWLETLPQRGLKQFAFGALFYEYLNVNKPGFEICVYEPEMYSGYRLFDDTYKILRKSSYDLTPKK
jgi:MoaA/NifB/PqqE/SkfB family radical SAM enzyme